MTRRFQTLAWTATACTYLLILLGAVVRITGSGLGCGNHWPLCNGHLFPPLNDLPTVIEWSHRLVAALVSILVLGLAVLNWRRAAPAVGLLVVQARLGGAVLRPGLEPVRGAPPPPPAGPPPAPRSGGGGGGGGGAWTVTT